MISTLTFLTLSTALTTVLLLPAATHLVDRAVRHPVAHLRLVQAGLLVPAEEGRGVAVDGSRAVPLVPRLRLRRQLRAVGRPVALLHLADPVAAARADNLGVRATTRRLRQWLRQLNKSARKHLVNVSISICSEFVELTSRHQSTGKKCLILWPTTRLPRTPPSST